MNKHLLQTRLKSIEHYANGLIRLQAAIKETQSTREDIIKGLAEFFPFEAGQFLARKGVIIKLLKFVCVCDSCGKLYFMVKVAYPKEGNYGGLEWRENSGDYSLSLEDIEKWKVIEMPQE